jgi:hypothetical protein
MKVPVSSVVSPIKRALELVEEVERLKRERDRSQGRMDQLLSRLKSEFDCDSLSQAEIYLHNLGQDIEKEEEELVSMLEDFKSKYHDKLEGM